MLNRWQYTRSTAVAVLTVVLVGWVLVAQASAQPIGFGCFADRATIGGVENWRAHVRLMKSAGMNTFVVSYGSVAELAEQIDIAIDEGMLETRIPVVAMACCMTSNLATAEEIASEPAVSGYAPGEFFGVKHAFDDARALSRHKDVFPELVGYTLDEPGRGDPVTPETMQALRDIHCTYRSMGVRLSGALCYPNTRNLFSVVDIPIINIIIGDDLPGDVKALNGRQFWTYCISLRHMTPSAVRYHVGLWTWQTGQQVNLNWDWAGLLGEQADMAHPVMNDRLRAFAEGVRDYWHLRKTEDRLHELRSQWNGDLMPVGWWTSHGAAQGCPAPMDLDKLLPERDAE